MNRASWKGGRKEDSRSEARVLRTRFLFCGLPHRPEGQISTRIILSFWEVPLSRRRNSPRSIVNGFDLLGAIS